MKNMLMTIALLSTINLSALDFSLVLSGSLGGEYGNLSTEISASQYSTTGGVKGKEFTSDIERDSNTVSGIDYKGTIGVAIQTGGFLEHRVFVLIQNANLSFESENEQINFDAQDLGIGYQIYFGRGLLRPYAEINIVKGKSTLQDLELDYIGTQWYGGLTYEILEGFEAYGQLGFRTRDFDSKSKSYTYQSDFLETTTVTATLSNIYIGLDARLGLSYRF